MDAELLRRWEKIWEVTWAGGKNTLKYFQREDIGYERKSDKSPVTVADRETEQLMRGIIQQMFPEDSVLGEEFGSIDGTSGYRWIMDPIDGTKAFIGGVPLYGTMLGLEWEGRCIAGAVAIPAIGEGIYACEGQGAWHIKDAHVQHCHVSESAVKNGDQALPIRAKVSCVDSLANSILAAAEPRTFQQRDELATLMELDKRVYVSRNWGDCYGYLLVATGRVEVMIDPIMSVWDAAAVQPILTESGGTFTDWNGESTIYNNEGLATNGKVLDEVLAITKAAKPYQVRA